MADNTNTTSSADTSSVTAIKVKVVLDTTTEELKNQFKGVQNSFKKAPVEIAFGVNEGATVGNVNAALKRIIKKVESPKLTLKIDESNIDAAVQKAAKKAQDGASKGSGTTVKVNADTKEATQKLNAFYSRVKEIGKVRAEIQDGMSDGTLSMDLKNSYTYLQKLREEAAELKKELGSAIPTGKYSKLSEISRNSPNRDRVDYDGIEKLKANVAREFYSNRSSTASAANAQEIANATEKLKQFYDLVKEINDLNQKLSTADPSKQSSRIDAWAERLSNAEAELKNLMTEYSEFINIGNGSKVEGLQSKLDTKNEFDFAKKLDEARQKIQDFQKDWNSLNLNLSSLGATFPGSEGLNNLRNTMPELQQMISNLQTELDNAAQSGDLTRLNKLFAQFSESLGLAGNAYKQFIQRTQVESKKLDESNHIKELIRNLQEYKSALTSSFNGTKFEEQYEDLLADLKSSNLSFKEAKQQVLDFKAACHDAGLETETLGQKLSRLFKEHFQTAIAMAGVAMVKQGLREVYNNVLELDTAVTELKKVSSMTGDEMNSYLERTATNARELGASISDLVTSTADWKRLGYTDEDSEELARVAALMANVGDGIDNATTASSYLISTMQGFGLVADDAEHLLDCMNQIANTEPVSMEDLGIIMQKSSAAMSAAGNTYQETLAMASALNGVLQDSESSGTFLKTLSMYLRASKTDAENAGIATDGMASSVSELRSELKQLAGVDIMKNDNTFKSTYQIMKELSEVWKDLSDTTQANITELISGKRGGQGTSALLNNFSVAEDAMKQALNSSGSAMRENETYMQSLQAKLNQLDSAFQKFSTDLMKSDIPKFFVDLATVFVDGADSAVKFAGALPTLTAAISGVLSVMQMSGKLKNGAGKVSMPSYICCV